MKATKGDKNLPHLKKKKTKVKNNPSSRSDLAMWIIQKLMYKVVIGSHTDFILQQLVVILTTSNNLIGSQYDYQLNYYL